MKFTLLLKGEGDSTAPLAVSQIERTGPLRAATLGLTLAESKSLLATVQQELVESQLHCHAQAQRICPQCGKRRALKDYRPACFESLFGGVDLRVPRFYASSCDDTDTQAETVRIEGLANWVSPELEFIQSQLGATIPYARSAELMALLLPVDVGGAPSTVRRRALRVGQRLDSELHTSVDTEPVAHAKDQGPVTVVGLDSGYVHDCRPQSVGGFEVVVGRILNENNESRSLGFVRSIESNGTATDRLKRRLGELGQETDDITALTDGDPGLRDLLMSALPHATHLLDWFHLTRRLTVLKRVLDGKEAIDQFQSCYQDRLCRHLESLKWRLWHGYIGGAFNRIRALLFTLRLASMTGKRAAVRLRRLIKDLLRYLKNNRDSLTNYGRRYRNGQRISTAFMESAVNQLIDKRMSKSQQMRWSPMGAHCLLQVRAELVDGRLGDAFSRWYPGFTVEKQLCPVAQ
jgi:hypothetical protein